MLLDVVSAGDLVIDFSQCGFGPNGHPAFEMNPGGAPANMLVACSLLGAKTAFIGKVGDDLFGRHVAGALKKYGILDEGVVYTDVDHTMITFVSLDEQGDRSFYFVGKGVDHLLAPEEVNVGVLERANIIYSTYGLAKSPVGLATLHFLQDYAEKHGKLFAVDPNYRPESSLHDPATVKQEFTDYISRADIVKVSEIELKLLTGLGDSPEECARGAELISKIGREKKAVFITLGAKGAYYYSKDEQGYEPGFRVKAVDTTGCGDSFLGAVLYFMACEPEVPLAHAVRWANAVGALCATKRGAFDAMPTRKEVEAFLAAQNAI